MADVWDDDLLDGPGVGAPPGESQTAARVFLSPRVVDKAAFDDFAAALRGLIDKAAAEKGQLATAAAGAEAVRRSLSETTSANEEHLALAAKALATAEQRDKAARRLLEDATSAYKAIERFEKETGSLIEQKLRSVEGRLADLHKRAATQTGDVESRLEGLLARLEERYAMLEVEAEGRIEKHAAAALKRLEALPEPILRRADEIEARLEGLLARVDERLAVLDHQAGGLVEARLEGMQSRLEAIQKPAANRAEMLEKRLGLVLGQVDERLRELEQEIDGRLRPNLGALTKTVERGVSLLGYEPGAGDDQRRDASAAEPAQGSLTALVARTERLSETAALATKQLEDVRKQADGARAILSESLSNWSTLIDDVVAHQERLRGLLRESEEMADETRADMEARLAAIRAAAAQAVADVEPLAARLRTDLEGLLARTDRARDEVKADLRGGLASLARSLREVADRAESQT